MPATYLQHETSTIALNRATMSQADFNAWFDESGIKLRVKKWCMADQKLRCCYCKQFTIGNAGVWDFEHVLPESTYPQFFAELLNVAAACKPCNNAKKARDPRRLSTTLNSTVPDSQSYYIIPHPHLSNWDDHLQHTSYLIYERKSDEGENLIDFCKLNRKAELAAGAPPGTARTALQNKWFEIAKTHVPDLNRDQAIALAESAIESQIQGQSAPDIAKIAKWLIAQERKDARLSSPSLQGPKAKNAKQPLAITYRPPTQDGGEG